MIERALEADERVRERLRSVARRHDLDDTNADFLSMKEVWEALRQFDMGLLPERLTSRRQKSN